MIGAVSPCWKHTARQGPWLALALTAQAILSSRPSSCLLRDGPSDRDASRPTCKNDRRRIAAEANARVTNASASRANSAELTWLRRLTRLGAREWRGAGAKGIHHLRAKARAGRGLVWLISR